MMYAIYHEYDVDGGFGDAISQESIVAICDSKEIAEAYAKRFDKTHVYEKPYASLYCGTLTVMPFDVPVITKENEMESPWDWTWCPDDTDDDDEDEEFEVIVEANNEAEAKEKAESGDWIIVVKGE